MTLPLPSALKVWLRPLPQWPPIALEAPQQAVRVALMANRGVSDVTGRAVVASLRPFTVAVGLDAPTVAAIEADPTPQLHFEDLESHRTVGVLQLQQVRNWATSGATVGLFEVRDGTQRCLQWPYRSWNRWLQNRRMRAKSDPNNFYMPPAAVQQQMIFYICPRPVVLVSVDDGSHNNLFPMDLIGPISADHFTLALRSTSLSIPAMKSARCVALSDVPAREFATAYKLGVHHKNVKVNWEELPFRIERSRVFSLPCPSIALRVRELAILDFDTIGSHTFFICRVVSDMAIGEGSQFFHTSGIYQHFRTRQARPFPSCN